MRDFKIDTPRIRQINRGEVFRFIKENPLTTRNDLVKQLELSLPTVTSIINELEEAGLVSKRKSSVNTGGRASMAYVCEADACVAAGIQLSERRIKGVLVNLMGNTVGKVIVREFPFEVTEDYRKAIGQLYRQLLDDNNIDEGKVLGAGVTVQGQTDDEGTRMVSCFVMSLNDVRRDELTKYIPVKNRLFHDLIAAGYNQKLRIAENVFYLSIDSSIGGSVIINNSVYLGNSNKAGEIGHLVLKKNGRKCYCGRYGCFDAYCNTLLLKDFAGGELADFFSGIDEGKPEFVEFWDEYVENLAEAICDVRLLFDGIILIGGEMGKYSEYYIDRIRSKVDEKNIFKEDRARDYVFAYEDGENAIATGAAMYYIKHVLEEF